jgi:hypothetical protein
MTGHPALAPVAEATREPAVVPPVIVVTGWQGPAGTKSLGSVSGQGQT